jgi:GntR family transcriptional regulator
MDLSRSAIARYIQLATLFRRRIQSGQWKLHDQIPTVEDLVEECGVARATVRQALGVLEKEGLIERFRAKGTFVTKRPEDDLWCPVHTDWDELIASHIETGIDILANDRTASRRCAAPSARRPELPPSQAPAAAIAPSSWPTVISTSGFVSASPRPGSSRSSSSA